MSERDVGPIDYLAIEFPDGQLKGEGLAAIVDLVDQGIIRLLDLRVVKVADNGDFAAIALTDLDGDGELDLAVFEGVQSGLLDDEDLAESAALGRPGSAVGLLVYENAWAGPFVSAMRRAGAEVISSGRIPAADVIAALEAMEAQDDDSTEED